MAVVVSSNFAKLLYPGINKVYGQAYNEWKPEWPKLFDTYTSKRAFEEDVQFTGLGLPSVKTEANSIVYDSFRQGFVERYVHVAYGLGFVISREAVEDEQYGVLSSKKAKFLAFSMRQGKEVTLANIYNRAWDTNYTMADGLPLVSTAHLNYTGGTFSNAPTSDADVSEAALEQACIDIGNTLNDRGLRISLMPRSIHYANGNQFEIKRILGSSHRVGTSDNDISALYAMDEFPGGAHMNHYFTDSDAWFIRTNLPEDGMKMFQRRKPEFTADNDFDTENAKYKATERYSGGCTDPRSIYASQGA